LLSNHFGGALPPDGLPWLIKELNEKYHGVSPINQIELPGYNGPAKNLMLIENFICNYEVTPIDDSVVAECILVRRPKQIELSDALIAATAIVHGLDIISRNEKNKGLKGVKVINLHKL